MVTLAIENAGKERDLKATLSPRIAEILKGKKLWVLGSMIRASGQRGRELKTFNDFPDQEFSARSFGQPA